MTASERPKYRRPRKRAVVQIHRPVGGDTLPALMVWAALFVAFWIVNHP